MSPSGNPEIERVACVGAGTVGAGWAAVFLARGLEVVAWDPGAGAEDVLRKRVAAALPRLAALGPVEGGAVERLRVAASVTDAVAEADFVQESAPDDEALKIELLREIDAAAPDGAVIASSSSTFLPTRLASKCANPERVLIGHPFVPVYLVPLVEVVGGELTSEDAMARACAFYARLGKSPLRLAREIEGYLANRLQRVLFEEARQLVDKGICTWDDVEDAVTLGPGLRWPVVGPVLHRHLGGGDGGVRHMLEHLGWRGTPQGKSSLVDAVERRWGNRSIAELEAHRDAQLVAMLRALDATEGVESP